MHLARGMGKAWTGRLCIRGLCRALRTTGIVTRTHTMLDHFTVIKSDLRHLGKCSRADPPLTSVPRQCSVTFPAASSESVNSAK